MGWTYGGDPSASAKDAVRFLVGDTDSTDQLLQDGEITYLLSQYNNAPLNAAIRACETIMAKFARMADETAPTDAQVVGHFRLGGEVHQWMYDRYSLCRLLTESGFSSIRVCQATDSSIKDFANYGLDTEPDGSVYKPDSFFVEAMIG